LTNYERIGGDAGVTALLERLYQRAVADPLFAPFFQSTNIERLKERQHAFISQAIGGPQRYAGPPLAVSHAHLRIEQHHFDAFVDHMKGALQDLGAPADLADQLMAQVHPLSAVIVNTR